MSIYVRMMNTFYIISLTHELTTCVQNLGYYKEVVHPSGVAIMESSSFGMHAAAFAAPLPVTSRIAPASHEHEEENVRASTDDAVQKKAGRGQGMDEVDGGARRVG